MTVALSELLGGLIASLSAAKSDDPSERSLYDGSEMSGDFNFRTDEMDLGLDAGGFYEEDL